MKVILGISAFYHDFSCSNNPDIVLDVSDMRGIGNESMDVVNAIELFEHVKDIDRGLSECYRVLVNDGLLIISVPFLYPVHGDSCDYQRWTEEKWRMELNKKNFEIQSLEIMGGFFTISADMYRFFLRSTSRWSRYFLYIFYPLVVYLFSLESRGFFKNRKLSGYHGGYYIIAKVKK